MIYKWYCHLRKKGYGIFTSFICAVSNSKHDFDYDLFPVEDIPRRWIDNRGARPYDG